MRPRDIYKACNYGVIDLNKGEDIITCLLCEGGGGQRISSVMSSFREKIGSIRRRTGPLIILSLQDENVSFQR